MFVFEDRISPKVDAQLAKAFKKHVAVAEKKKLLKQQTEMFWYLQLQFLSMSRFSIGAIALYYFGSGMYKPNIKTQKAKRLADAARWDTFHYTKEDHECLATHLALQLAGIEA